MRRWDSSYQFFFRWKLYEFGCIIQVTTEFSIQYDRNKPIEAEGNSLLANRYPSSLSKFYPDMWEPFFQLALHSIQRHISHSFRTTNTFSFTTTRSIPSRIYCVIIPKRTFPISESSCRSLILSRWLAQTFLTWTKTTESRSRLEKNYRNSVVTRSEDRDYLQLEIWYTGALRSAVTNRI